VYQILGKQEHTSHNWRHPPVEIKLKPDAMHKYVDMTEIVQIVLVMKLPMRCIFWPNV